MTQEEYNKSRPGETVVYQDSKVVIRVNVKEEEVRIFVHSKSKDGYEQLPLGYVLGSNNLMYKIR